MNANAKKPIRLLSLIAAATNLAYAAPAVIEDTQNRAGRGPDARTSAAQPVMSDASLAAAAKDELHMDPVFATASLEVTARDGAITLSGETRTLLAKERAERIAETVRGVRSVDNRIVVRPDVRRDAIQTRRLIELNLQQDPVAEAFEITVLATDAGEVTLRGTVDSWTERLFVGNAAKRVIGVRSVDNQVEVKPRTARLDSEVRADVLGKLRWDAYLDASAIDVAVTGGAVQLTGAVRSAAEKRRAMSIAWGPGVESVSTRALRISDIDGAANRRSAANMHARSGEAVAEIIAARYSLSPRLSGADVRVDVDAGIVTLRGSVRDLRGRRAAGALARDTAGVKAVRNRLVVRSTEAVRPEDDVRDAVEQALQRDAMTQGAGITVRVDAGRVELLGEVDSALARLAAEDVVAGIRGVNEIDNRLAVDPKASHYAMNPFIDDWSDGVSDDEPPGFRREGTAAVTRGSDRQIEAEIRRQFWWSAFVDQDDIELAVDDGVATLTGVVGTRAEESAAVQNALQGGATAVINQLQVGG